MNLITIKMIWGAFADDAMRGFAAVPFRTAEDNQESASIAQRFAKELLLHCRTDAEKHQVKLLSAKLEGAKKRGAASHLLVVAKHGTEVVNEIFNSVYKG